MLAENWTQNNTDDNGTEEVEVDQSALESPSDEVVSEDGLTTTLFMPDEGNKNQNAEWFDNLAETLPDDVLDDLGQKYLQLLEQDIESRKPRDEQQALGLKKSGIGDDAPGGADFEGASRVTHPVLAEASIDFAASAIKELFPPNGPVKIYIEGKPNKQKTDKAKRKAEFMNWQLTREMPSYRPELERLLTQLPFGGSQYMKLYWDGSKGRPEAEFVPVDDFILPYDARNFFDTQRKFHRMNVSDFMFERRIVSGMYRDYSLPDTAVALNDETKSQQQTAKIEGKVKSYQSEEGERIIFEGVIYEQIEEDDLAPEDKAPPYIISIDHETGKVLSLYRNWAEDDDNCREIEYIVDFTFIPWRGALGIGLEHIIGGLSTALTGSLRALLDSALISNVPGALKLKGLPSGESVSVSPTQVTEIDSGGMVDDIRKLFMPLPFNQPSPVLFQLLGFLDGAAKGVVSTAEEKIADATNNMPVGTALALIEQGAKVFSAIHARIHDSQRRCFEILHRIDRDNLPDKVQFASDPEDFVTRADFEGHMDVQPVSDPNIFSESQRFAQIQFVMQTVLSNAQTAPQILQLVDLRALLARAFEQAKIPDYEEFLPEIPVAKPLNPVEENIAMVMGKPVKAYPGQDHLAHIQVLLDFGQNPMLGKSPVIAQKFMPAGLNHLQDHILCYYEELTKQNAATSIGKQADDVEWDNDPKASAMLAASCATVDKALEVALKKIPDVIMQAMQFMQANAPKPPQDPMVAVAMQEVQGKQKVAEGNLSLKQQQIKSELDTKRILAQAKLAEAEQKAKEANTEYELEIQKMGLEATTKIRTANISSQTDMAKTIHDNHTKETIASMGHSSNERIHENKGDE